MTKGLPELQFSRGLWAFGGDDAAFQVAMVLEIVVDLGKLLQQLHLSKTGEFPAPRLAGYVLDFRLMCARQYRSATLV